MSVISSLQPPSGDQHEIVHGAQRAVVVEVGGGLRSYEVGGAPVLDGYPVDQRCGGGRGQTLIPWPNRTRDGQYEFDGEHQQLPLTEPASRTAIHGLVRWASWSVADRGGDWIAMASRRGRGRWSCGWSTGWERRDYR